MEFAVAMVEHQGWIEASATELCFKMQVLCSCTTCATSKSYHLTCFHFIACLNKVLRLMAIQCLKTIGMLYAYAIAIACKRTRGYYYAIESCKYLVIWLCF